MATNEGYGCCGYHFCLPGPPLGLGSYSGIKIQNSLATNFKNVFFLLKTTLNKMKDTGSFLGSFPGLDFPYPLREYPLVSISFSIFVYLGRREVAKDMRNQLYTVITEPNISV